MVPKRTKGQKEEYLLRRMKRLTEEPHLLTNIITCHETRLFQNDSKTNLQSMQWKTTTSARMKQREGESQN